LQDLFIRIALDIYFIVTEQFNVEKITISIVEHKRF